MQEASLGERCLGLTMCQAQSRSPGNSSCRVAGPLVGCTRHWEDLWFYRDVTTGFAGMGERAVRVEGTAGAKAGSWQRTRFRRQALMFVTLQCRKCQERSTVQGAASSGLASECQCVILGAPTCDSPTRPALCPLPFDLSDLPL